MATATQGIDIVVGAKTQQASAALALLNGFVQGIGQAVANFAGRAARALVEMTGEAIHTADEMGKLAQKAGTTTEKISALGYAAKLSDVSLGGLQVGFKGLSAWMEKNGQVGRDVIDVMLEQSDVLAAMADGAAKTNLAMDLFGRSGQELIPLLNQGSEAIRQQMEEAKALGVVISGDAAASAEVFNDRITTMKTRFEGVFLQLSAKLLPGLMSLSDVLMATLEEGGPFLDFLTEAGGLMSKAADAAGWLASQWQITTTLMGSFVGALAAGMSAQEAWNEATKDATDAQARWAGVVERYRVSREKANRADAAAGGEAEALASKYETVAMDLKLVDYALANANPENRNQLLQRRLDLLAELARQSGEIKTVAGDGSVEEIYTADGLKAAERQLEIVKEIDATMQSISGMSFGDRLQQNIEAMGSSMQRLADFTTNFVTGAMQGLAGSLTDVIMGTKSAGQAFAEFGLSLLTNFLASVMEMILISLVAIPLLTSLGILSAGATVGPGVGIVTGALAAGSSAAAGITAGFAEGGSVWGAGTGTSDSILTRLSNGEFVVNAAAADSIGHDTLAQANETGELPSSGASPVQVNIAIFGGEAAAKRWAESQEGQTHFVNLVREQVGRYS